MPRRLPRQTELPLFRPDGTAEITAPHTTAPSGSALPTYVETMPRTGAAKVGVARALTRGRGKRDRIAGRHELEILALVPLAQRLADAAGPAGIIQADLRLEAERRGLVPNDADGRELSWLGAVMKRADLVATHLFRRSPIKRQHGIPQLVWVAPAHHVASLHGARALPSALPSGTPTARSA